MDDFLTKYVSEPLDRCAGSYRQRRHERNPNARTRQWPVALDLVEDRVFSRALGTLVFLSIWTSALALAYPLSVRAVNDVSLYVNVTAPATPAVEPSARTLLVWTPYGDVTWGFSYQSEVGALYHFMLAIAVIMTCAHSCIMAGNSVRRTTTVRFGVTAWTFGTAGLVAWIWLNLNDRSFWSVVFLALSEAILLLIGTIYAALAMRQVAVGTRDDSMLTGYHRVRVHSAFNLVRRLLRHDEAADLTEQRQSHGGDRETDEHSARNRDSNSVDSTGDHAHGTAADATMVTGDIDDEYNAFFLSVKDATAGHQAAHAEGRHGGCLAACCYATRHCCDAAENRHARFETRADFFYPQRLIFACAAALLATFLFSFVRCCVCVVMLAIVLTERDWRAESSSAILLCLQPAQPSNWKRARIAT